MDEVIHLSPSNLSSWDELRKADDDAPPWVNPKSFKDQIMGKYTPNLKAEAGNACHEFVFSELPNDEQLPYLYVANRIYFDETGEKKLFNAKFSVCHGVLQARKHFDYGCGVTEVAKTKYLDRKVLGYSVRLSERADYLSKSLITDLKTSSKPFSGKGKTRSFMEGQQSFSYTLTWGLPIRFVFAEIAIKEADDVHKISLKNLSSCTAYPCQESDARLYECVETLIPYLQSDNEMWHRVTNRTEQEQL